MDNSKDRAVIIKHGGFTYIEIGLDDIILKDSDSTLEVVDTDDGYDLLFNIHVNDVEYRAY